MNLFNILDDRFVVEVFIKNIYPQGTGIVYDIGTNNGEYALYTYNTASKIIAVEPNPVASEELRKQIDRYGLNKIKLYQQALAIKSGTVYMNNWNTYGGAVISESETLYGVTAITLNDLMKYEKDDHIDLFKIDIEGYENVLFTQPDFPWHKIKMISGEHCSHSQLKAHGFKFVTNYFLNEEYGRSG